MKHRQNNSIKEITTVKLQEWHQKYQIRVENRLNKDTKVT
jgi:hypothetical protein